MGIVGFGMVEVGFGIGASCVFASASFHHRPIDRTPFKDQKP